MAHGSVADPYRWDQCFIPRGTGAGPTEEGVCYWLTRLNRHLGGMPHLIMTSSKWDTWGRSRKLNVAGLLRFLCHDLVAVC